MKELNYQWYILSVRGGREEKVIAKIKLELEKKGLSDYVRDLKFASDDQKKNILKGYIFVHCHLTPELVSFFYRILEIIGFLNHQRGDDKLPDFVSEAVIKSFLEKIKERKENKVGSNYEKTDLNIGDLVKITEGIFANKEGRITHLDKKKQKAKITIESSGWEITDVPVNICQKISGSLGG